MDRGFYPAPPPLFPNPISISIFYIRKEFVRVRIIAFFGFQFYDQVIQYPGIVILPIVSYSDWHTQFLVLLP